MNSSPFPWRVKLPEKNERTEVFELDYVEWSIDTMPISTDLMMEECKSEIEFYQFSMEQSQTNSSTDLTSHVNFRIFDLAGHDDYQLFQSLMSGKSCIYLLVVDLSECDDELVMIRKVHEWLDLIQTRSPYGVNIFLVGTHLDKLELSGTEETNMKKSWTKKIQKASAIMDMLEAKVRDWIKNRPQAIEEYRNKVKKMYDEDATNREILGRKLNEIDNQSILRLVGKKFVSSKFGFNIRDLKNEIVKFVQLNLKDELQRTIPSLFQPILTKILRLVQIDPNYHEFEKLQKLADCLTWNEFLKEFVEDVIKKTAFHVKFEYSPFERGKKFEK